MSHPPGLAHPGPSEETTMATQYTTVELVVLVDSCGDSAIGTDAEAAREAYEENVQALNECDGFRIVKVRVRVPLPEIATLEVEALAPEIESPADAGDVYNAM